MRSAGFNKIMDAVEKVRVLVCGDDGVGKKRLIESFTDVSERRTSTLSTIGVDVQCKTVCIGDKTVKLQIWTTAGLEKFRSIPAKYYGRADGVILVYDVTRTKSFDSVSKWLADISQSVDVKIALVGNKTDLSFSQADIHARGKTLASASGILYFETSAVTGENVHQLFHSLTTDILNKSVPCTREEFNVDNERNSSEVTDLTQPRRHYC